MATARFFLGVDGGATRCRARLRDSSGRELGHSVGPASNIYIDFRHPTEDHSQPMVAQRPSCPIVPPAAHGQRKTMGSSGTHRLLHISRALTEGKQRWPAIQCAVEHLARRLVGSFTCDRDVALY